MEKRDFLYQFTKIFLSEAVKETILIENWEEKDFDPRYIEYSKFFLLMKKNYLMELTEKNLIDKFTSSKNHVVKKFNEKFSNHFRKEIMRHGCIEEEFANNLLPENIFSNNTINKDTLKIFREFEENLLSTKQGGKFDGSKRE